MADIGQPQGQGVGQGLADLFGNVNRPALNAFVATSQAKNGLVSAQTQDAMIKASQAQEHAEAKGRIKDDLISNGAPESEAQLATDAMVAANNGDAVTGMKVLQQAKLMYGNPQSQVQGQQGAEGKLATPPTVPNNYLPVPGTPGTPGAPAYAGIAPVQSPEGAAQTADTKSQTALRNAKTAAGGFNPHASGQGGALDPQAVDFGAYMLYKTGKMPALGMGGGQARMAIISRASQLAQQEYQGQPVTNPGYDTAIANGQDFTGAQRQLNSQ